MIVAPTLHRLDQPDTRAALLWTWPQPMPMISSAAVGGGFVRARTIVNIGVRSEYHRTDLCEHATEIRSRIGAEVAGPSLLTAADVTLGVSTVDHDVRCDATVGITRPTWAADVDDAFVAWSPGTVNLVVQVPVRLVDAAFVNAVITATEAKAQAFREAGIPGTGTASDAIVVVGADRGPTESFGGPRSQWGARIARAVRDAVALGIVNHP